MSLLDQLREYSEGEEPASASDAALIDGALEQALVTPSAGAHPAVVVGGVAAVVVVAAVLLWPSAPDPSPAPPVAAAAPDAPSPASAPASPQAAGEPERPRASVVEPPVPDTSRKPPSPEPAAPENTRVPEKRASLNDLLERAQARRAAGAHSEAAQFYRRAIRSYPKVPAARRALVTLAELELTQLGRPAAALKTFERYLQHGKDPVLVQEAGYGRLRTLRKLGRSQAEAEAIASFLAAHPKSPYRNALQERQKKLVTPSVPPGLNPSDD